MGKQRSFSKLLRNFDGNKVHFKITDGETREASKNFSLERIFDKEISQRISYEHRSKIMDRNV